jgi:MinD-like ATPase involved in chromosome partitioning or flagellar assembly
VTAAPGRATVIVVASGHGAPGRTTVALNLATALGAVAPTVLIDADMSGPTVAAYVDGDPTRNLAMVAHAEPATARDWARAIEQELQPLGERSRGGAVLCGLPRAEMRAAISAPFAERLIAELAGHHRYVVVDVAAELLGPEAVVHRTVLALADEVFLVAAADLAGLWHAREALRRFGAQVGVPAERVRLVINRYDRRFHHTRTEIEWALGLPAAAVISHDQAGVQRAIAAQRPVVLDERSRAGRALLDLAERLHGGRVLLPPEEREQHRGERLRRWMAQRMRPVFRPLRTQMRVRVLAAALPGLVRRAQSTRVMRPVPGPDTPATGTALAPEAAAGTARGRAAGEAAEVAGLADSVGVAEVAGAAGHTVRRHTREEEMA